jgi:hypothetical protein
MRYIAAHQSHKAGYIAALSLGESDRKAKEDVLAERQQKTQKPRCGIENCSLRITMSLLFSQTPRNAHYAII